MIRSLILAPMLAAAWCVVPSQARPEVTCNIDESHPIIIPNDPHQRGEMPKHAYKGRGGAILFVGRLAVDADGAPRAYGPKNSGLDWTKNAGVPGNWWGLATDAKGCGPRGNPILQSAGDPAPGFYVSTTSMRNPAIPDCKSPSHYVDSSKIPFVALPPAIAHLASNRGRLVAIYRPDKGMEALAIHADQAPRSGMGEGSIALAEKLGFDSDPRSGGTDRRMLVYVVLSDTAGFPASAAIVRAEAGTALDAWGGSAALKACADRVLSLPR